jgi:amino acid transporter
MKPTTLPPEAPSSLLRVLGPWTATAVVVGTVIGSGVFKKPQAVTTNVPEFGPAMLVWVLGGVLALLGALTLSEVSVLYPRAGGNYVFLREAYGRLAGFLWGWVEFWIIRSSSIAALAVIFTESFHAVLKQVTPADDGGDVLGFWPKQFLTVGVIAALAAVNVRGTRWGGYLQLFLTLVKVASLLAIFALPFVVAGFFSTTRPPAAENLAPIWPADFAAFKWSAFGAGLVGVLWAYHGWMNIAPVAEEVRNPSRNIPLALIGGVFILITLYLGANLAYYLVLTRAEIVAAKDVPVASVFGLALLGPAGATAVSAAIMISVFGALNGNLLVGPRLLYAMGEDGLAPKGLGAVHPRYRTPALAITVLATWASIIVLAAAALTRNELPALDIAGVTLDLNLPKGKPLFDVVTDFAMFGAVSFETCAVASVYVFRRRFPPAQVALPYRCVGYPVVPALYIAIMASVLANMFVTQRTEALVGVGFIVVGAAVYGLVFAGKGRPS